MGLNKEDEQIIKRILDLAKTSYNQNRYTFSHFLTVDEQGLVDTNAKELSYVHYEMFGGHECCERQIIRFGDEENLGYKEEFPITTLRIEPLVEKFSDELGHRDYLGALMNLGIKREFLGDIIVKEKSAYVFCLSDISDYVRKELTRIKHTSVKITAVDDGANIEELSRELEDFEVLVSAPRFDAIVAAICKLSRGQAQQLFVAKKVLLNNRVCENNSAVVKPNSTITIRGYGKYIYIGEGGKTRKDRVYVHLQRYV